MNWQVLRHFHRRLFEQIFGRWIWIRWGVSKGFEKGLEINGVGYKFNVSGNKLNITAGFSHPVVMDVPAGLSVEQISNTEITIKGIDKQKVTEFAANIREWLS